MKPGRLSLTLAALPLLVSTTAAAQTTRLFDPSKIEAATPVAGETGPFRTAIDLQGGDGRRTLAAFPANLARSFVGVLSGDNIAPLLVGAGVAATGHALDAPMVRLLESRCLQCGRTGATVGGAAIVPAVGMVFLAGRLSPQGTFRDASYDFAQALAVNAAWTGALKHSLQRRRPNGSDSLSLPSGHTSTAFSLATVANGHYGWKVGVPAFVLASGIGLSRIESSNHHFSDVLAGATIGVIVGRTVTRVNGDPRRGRRAFAITPSTDARGGGVGLGLSASW